MQHIYILIHRYNLLHKFLLQLSKHDLITYNVNKTKIVLHIFSANVELKSTFNIITLYDFWV